MEDEEVGEEGPLSFGHDLQEITLHLFGVVLERKAEPVGEAPDVGVHDHALVYAEGVTQDHVGGLAAHAGEPDELGHGARHFSPVFFDEYAGHAPYGASLVAEEAHRPYLLLQLLEVGRRV